MNHQRRVQVIWGASHTGVCPGEADCGWPLEGRRTADQKLRAAHLVRSVRRTPLCGFLHTHEKLGAGVRRRILQRYTTPPPLSIVILQAESALDVPIASALNRYCPDCRQAGTVNVAFPPLMKRRSEPHWPVVAL